VTGAGSDGATGPTGVDVDPRASALVRTTLVGVAAWLVALVIIGLIGLTGDPPISDDVPLWKGLAWFFLDAQFVPVVETSGRETVTIDLFELLDSPFTPLAYPTPPVALAAAGAAVVRRGWLDDLDLSPAAAGLAVCPGYLVPTLILAAVSGHTIVLDLPLVNVVRNVTPRVGLRLLLVALGYPIVFGGIGGRLAASLGWDD